MEAWCDWEGKHVSWVGPLPSIDMVSMGSVNASPCFLRFRDPENFVAGNRLSYLSYWEVMLRGYSKEQEIYRFPNARYKGIVIYI